MTLPRGYDVVLLAVGHAEALAAAYRRNRAHLAPFEPVREESFFTTAGQAAIARDRVALAEAGRALTWVVLHDDEVVGRVALNDIVRGPFCSGHLGYWVDAEHTGRGVAAGAVEQVCADAREAGLHRVQAGTLVDNDASQAVLRKCGFSFFGLAPDYLFIDGAWRDHRLYQRILHDEPLQG